MHGQPSDTEDESGDDRSDSNEREEERAPADRAPPSAVPFTFACASSHAQLLEAVRSLSVADHALVVERMRTLHHVRLHPDNKQRLQVRCCVCCTWRGPITTVSV